MRITIDCHFYIHNMTTMKAWAREVAHLPNNASFSAYAVAALINPERKPEHTGFRLLDARGAKLGRTDPKRYPNRSPEAVVAVDTEVFDPDAVMIEAKRRYWECWHEDDWDFPTVGDALYNILIASNASPLMPLDLGFELIGPHYIGDEDGPLSIAILPIMSDGVQGECRVRWADADETHLTFDISVRAPALREEHQPLDDPSFQSAMAAASIREVGHSLSQAIASALGSRPMLQNSEPI